MFLKPINYVGAERMMELILANKDLFEASIKTPDTTALKESIMSKETAEKYLVDKEARFFFYLPQEMADHFDDDGNPIDLDTAAIEVRYKVNDNNYRLPEKYKNSTDIFILNEISVETIELDLTSGDIWYTRTNPIPCDSPNHSGHNVWTYKYIDGEFKLQIAEVVEEEV